MCPNTSPASIMVSDIRAHAGQVNNTNSHTVFDSQKKQCSIRASIKFPFSTTDRCSCICKGYKKHAGINHRSPLMTVTHDCRHEMTFSIHRHHLHFPSYRRSENTKLLLPCMSHIAIVICLRLVLSPLLCLAAAEAREEDDEHAEEEQDHGGEDRPHAG